MAVCTHTYAYARARTHSHLFARSSLLISNTHAHTHTLALRTFANNAHLCVCLYFVFAVGHTFLSRSLAHSLSLSLPSIALCCFKTYCAARIFSTMWVALSLSSRRSAAHRVVWCVRVCVYERERANWGKQQQKRVNFSSCFYFKKQQILY